MITFTLPLSETNNFQFNHPGFVLKDETGKEVAEFCANAVGGAPIIRIYAGPNKGRSFTVPVSTIRAVMEQLLQVEYHPETETP